MNKFVTFISNILWEYTVMYVLMSNYITLYKNFKEVNWLDEFISS